MIRAAACLEVAGHDVAFKVRGTDAALMVDGEFLDSSEVNRAEKEIIFRLRRRRVNVH